MWAHTCRPVWGYYLYVLLVARQQQKRVEARLDVPEARSVVIPCRPLLSLLPMAMGACHDMGTSRTPWRMHALRPKKSVSRDIQLTLSRKIFLACPSFSIFLVMRCCVGRLTGGPFGWRFVEFILETFFCVLLYGVTFCVYGGEGACDLLAAAADAGQVPGKACEVLGRIGRYCWSIRAFQLVGE
ncbi:hypothetical protein V8C26DRAFT_358226 [Trichoderma gracile]